MYRRIAGFIAIPWRAPFRNRRHRGNWHRHPGLIAATTATITIEATTQDGIEMSATIECHSVTTLQRSPVRDAAAGIALRKIGRMLRGLPRIGGIERPS